MNSVFMIFSTYDSFWSCFHCINNVKMKNLSIIIYKSDSAMTKEHQGSKWSKDFTEATFYQLVENVSVPSTFLKIHKLKSFPYPPSSEASNAFHLWSFLRNDQC